MLRGHAVSPTSPQGRNATEGGAEVLLAISREPRESPEEYAATVPTRPASPQGRTNTAVGAFLMADEYRDSGILTLTVASPHIQYWAHSVRLATSGL